MYDLIDCKKQSHDTTSSTEHQILDQCKTKITENFFKCCEGYTLNNRRSPTGDELQSFDVFRTHNLFTTFHGELAPPIRFTYYKIPNI